MSFNNERFLALWRWDLINFQKEYRNYALLCFAGALFIILIGSGILFSFGDFSVPPYYAEKCSGFASLFLIFAMLSFAGRSFDHLRTNQERLSYFMIPASNMEKFLVRVPCRILLYFLLTLLAYIAASIVFALLVGIYTHEWFFAIPLDKVFSNLNIFGYWKTTIGSVFSYVSLLSCYIFGAAFFRRRAMLFTTLSILAVALLFSSVMGITSLWFISHLEDWTVRIELLMDVENFFLIVSTIVSLIFTTLFLWGAYRIFCRMQVINNRWRNK